MIRILWNKYEAAILIEACLQVIEDKKEWEEIEERVSNDLRQMAINQGIQINDLYRNINGIRMQMSIMISIMENKKAPLHSSPKIFMEVANIYKSDKPTFFQILNEAKAMTSKSYFDKHDKIVKEDKDMIDHSDRGTFNASQVNEPQSESDKQIKQANTFVIDFDNMESLTFTRPTSLEIFGSKYTDITDWRSLYVRLLTMLYERNPIILDQLKNKSIASGKKDFSNELGYHSMRAPKEITKEFYAETNLSATDICKKIRTLLNAYDISYNDVQIYYEKKNNSKSTSTQSTSRSNHATVGWYKDVNFSRYYEILSSKYPRGFRLKDNLDIKKFRRYWKELYNEENNLSNEAIWDYIGHITIAHDKMSYLPEMMMGKKTKEELFNYLDETFANGIKAIYYKALYLRFRDQLDNGRINNAEMLKTYLEYTNQGKYFLQKAYIAVDRSVKVDPTEEVRSFLKSHELPMTTENIIKSLPHIDEYKIKSSLSGNNSYEFVRNQKGEYFHADIIEFTDQELAKIEEWISESISQNEYISGKELTSLIDKYLPEIHERYTFLTELGLRDTIAYKLSGKFSFKGEIISRIGEDLNMDKVFASFGKNHTLFNMDQLTAFKDDLGAAGIYFDSLYCHAMRISKNEFVSRDNADFDISATDDAIEQFCTGDFISIQDVTLFGGFPSCGSAWNSYLLEYYVMYFSKKFKLLHTNFNKTSSVGAIVKKNADIETFDDVIVQALANSAVSLNTDDALNYLCESGFLARRNYGTIDNIVSQAKAYRALKGE